MNNNGEYLSYDQYVDVFGLLEKFSVIILFSFENNSIETRDEIIRNFIAKTLTSLRSIIFIWKLGDFDNCWSIFRIMLDRLFHLQALFDNNNFEEFEKWSFFQQHKDILDAKSDPEFHKLIEPNKIRSKISGLDRYKKLQKEGINWNRPKARDVAQSMDLLFLYKYGYDYASKLIHPMADDGKINYTQIISDKIVYFEDQKAVLQNSFFIHLYLIQKGLNASSLIWRTIVYDFIDDCLSAISGNSDEYKISFQKLLLMEKEMPLCEKRNGFSKSI